MGVSFYEDPKKGGVNVLRGGVILRRGGVILRGPLALALHVRRP